MVKDLRHFLDKVQKETPEDFIVINKEIDPKFEITAIQQKLEDENRWPILMFNNVKNNYGEPSGFRVATNVFSTRQHCALALDMPKEKYKMELSQQYAHRAMNPIKPVVIEKADAPCKEVIITGEDVDLFKLPVLTHHEMDGMPYLPNAVVAADPDAGRSACRVRAERQVLHEPRLAGGVPQAAQDRAGHEPARPGIDARSGAGGLRAYERGRSRCDLRLAEDRTGESAGQIAELRDRKLQDGLRPRTIRLEPRHG